MTLQAKEFFNTVSSMDYYHSHRRENHTGRSGDRLDNNTLSVAVWGAGTQLSHAIYDFLQRRVTTSTSGVTPEVRDFKDVDPEVLEWHHQLLISLGGKPQPLPDRDVLKKPQLQAAPSSAVLPRSGGAQP